MTTRNFAVPLAKVLGGGSKRLGIQIEMPDISRPWIDFRLWRACAIIRSGREVRWPTVGYSVVQLTKCGCRQDTPPAHAANPMSITPT
jgi:hypothetical protein